MLPKIIFDTGRGIQYKQKRSKFAEIIPDRLSCVLRAEGKANSRAAAGGSVETNQPQRAHCLRSFHLDFGFTSHHTCVVGTHVRLTVWGGYCFQRKDVGVDARMCPQRRGLQMDGRGVKTKRDSNHSKRGETDLDLYFGIKNDGRRCFRKIQVALLLRRYAVIRK